MIQKTISGKKCPKCASFIKADQPKCSVCGFEFGTQDEGKKEETELPVTIKTGGNYVACPKCQTRNNPDFKFCKICKHPLSEYTLGIDKPVKKLLLNFDWLSTERDGHPPKEDVFKDFLPYFDGCLQWQGYAFCAYKKKNKFGILCRKTDPSTSALLYRKCAYPQLEMSGNVFFLGAIKIKLMGDVNSREEQQAVVSSEKTLFVGPGRGPGENSEKKGLPRLEICDMDLKTGTVEIGGKILLGRDFLTKHTDLDNELMRQNGVSNEHAYLTPLPGSKWLIDPLPGKTFFTEICEEPVVLYKEDIVRFAADHHVGECRITVKETGI